MHPSYSIDPDLAFSTSYGEMELEPLQSANQGQDQDPVYHIASILELDCVSKATEMGLEIVEEGDGFRVETASCFAVGETFCTSLEIVQHKLETAVPIKKGDIHPELDGRDCYPHNGWRLAPKTPKSP